MDTIIIGQGYNLQEETSVGKELIEQFNSKRYDSFTCLVAFASYSGVSALTRYIQEGKERGMSIKVILGIDQKGTSKEALEEVLKWNVDARIYHTGSINIFHPKVYLFENIDIFTLIVGSNNLTVPGLVQNVECSLLIKDIKSNPVHRDFYEYWKGILDGSEDNLYPITQDLIDKLYEDKVIPSDSERAERYDNANDTTQEGKKRNITFKSTKIQSLPNGFRPTQRHIKVKMQKVKGERTKSNNDESLYIGKEILIAEIGGGDRWRQVNFPISIFENFFGAHKGDNSYTIELQNISKDGIIGELETRQAVTVKSQNYRFEIKCAETSGPYPGKDKRPIGIYIKLDSNRFLYQVLLHGDIAYQKVKDYLYMESESNPRELKRAIVDVEGIHAVYPELVL